MNTIEEAKKLAEKYCDEQTFNHVTLVVKLAKEFAEKYSADAEVIEIAAWLHDIGRYDVDGKEHPIRSVELAADLVQDHPKKELINECILKHGTRGLAEENRIEVKIMQCADGLSFYYDEHRIQKTKQKGKWEKRVAKTMKKASVLPEGKKRAEERLKEIIS